MLLGILTEVRSNDDAMEQLLKQNNAIPVMSDLMERHRPLHVQEAAAGVIGILCTWDEEIQVRAVNANAVKRLMVLLTVGPRCIPYVCVCVCVCVRWSVREGGTLSCLRESECSPIQWNLAEAYRF